MYGVVARWEFDPKNEPELIALTKPLGEKMRAWPGVESMIDIRVAPNAILSVMTYTDEPTYQKLIHDPEGPFEKVAKESGLDRLATWVWSERGEVL